MEDADGGAKARTLSGKTMRARPSRSRSAGSFLFATISHFDGPKPSSRLTPVEVVGKRTTLFWLFRALPNVPADVSVRNAPCFAFSRFFRAFPNVFVGLKIAFG